MDENSRTESIAVSACMRKVQSLLEFKDTTSKCSKSFTFVTILNALAIDIQIEFTLCNTTELEII